MVILFRASPTSCPLTKALVRGHEVGRYATGLAVRSASIPQLLHRVWLRIRYTTRYAALMQIHLNKTTL